jgi:hypothetical protein
MGSNPAKDKGFLRVIKIHTTPFGEEVKPVVPNCKILRHAEDPYSMKEIPVGKIHGHFLPNFSCFATRCLSGYCQRALMGESGMITAQMGKHNRSIMVSVWDTLCDTTL